MRKAIAVVAALAAYAFITYQFYQLGVRDGRDAMWAEVRRLGWHP
jgi:hypothetical protein